MNQDDEKAKKAEKKAKLKAEAEKLGISYEELKAQKKDKKSKRKREADKLGEDNDAYEGGKDREQERKRMRTYSGDFDAEERSAKDKDASSVKRLRTRSMDKAEDIKEIVKEEKSHSPQEWRDAHNITIRGYGTRTSEKFADPFIEFDDAPFNPVIQKTLKSAGFDRPTFIQSQVNTIETIVHMIL